MDVDGMRVSLKDAYPYKGSQGWIDKVDAMHDRQVKALYLKFKYDGHFDIHSKYGQQYIKDNNLTMKETPRKNYKGPVEHQMSMWDLFDLGVGNKDGYNVHNKYI